MLKHNRNAEVGIDTVILVIGILLVAVLVSGTLIHLTHSIAQQVESTGSEAYENVRTVFSTSLVGIYIDRISSTKPASNSTPIFTDDGFTDASNVLPQSVINNAPAFIHIAINVSRVVIEETWTVECGGNALEAANGQKFYLNGTKSGYVATGNSGTNPGDFGAWFGNEIIQVRVREPTEVNSNYSNEDYFRFTVSWTLETSATGELVAGWIMIDLAIHSPVSDMDDVILQISASNVHRKLDFSGSSSANATHYGAECLRDPEGYWAAENIIGSGSIIRIIINSSGLDLGPQDVLTVRIIPKQGPAKLIEQTMPERFQVETRYVEIYAT